MNDPEIRMLVRAARRSQRVGRNATCEACGAQHQLRRLSDGRTLCYGCLQGERGNGPTETDHIAEQANLGGLTAELLLNDHRLVTEYRMRLGVDDWPEADGDWRLLVAHVLAGMASYLFLIAEWLVSLVVAQGAGATVRAFPIVP